MDKKIFFITVCMLSWMLTSCSGKDDSILISLPSNFSPPTAGIENNTGDVPIEQESECRLVWNINGVDEYDTGIYSCEMVSPDGNDIECFSRKNIEERILYQSPVVEKRYVCSEWSPPPSENPLSLSYGYFFIDGQDGTTAFYPMKEWDCNDRYAYADNDWQDVFCYNRENNTSVIHRFVRFYVITP